MEVLAVTLSPPLGLIGWILVGLIAGALAGRITRGRGYGCLADIVMGLIGAVVGGWLVDAFAPGPHVFHFLGSILVALLGALVLIAVLRLIRAAL